MFYISVLPAFITFLFRYICKKINMRGRIIPFLTALSFLLFYACREDEPLSNDIELGFSADTVYFDTLLSTLGSVTQYFLIYNQYNEPVEIEKILLARGRDSYFRLNLDGDQGDEFSKVRIPAKDSLFMFVEATIDKLDENNPLLIKDSVLFITGSGTQDVKLIAYGQDVHVYNGEIFKSQKWTKDKPYLIINSAALDSNEVLTIEPGTQIFLTSTSSLVVWGSIKATGTFEEPIIFSGARFDGRFEESAGQWRTIYIGGRSKDNLLEHVIIKNATAGIQVGHPENKDQPDIELRNCMILNSSSLGIFAFNAAIDAYNTVIADCGALALYIQMGGRYNFYHCTVSNISAYYPDFLADSDYKGRYNPSVFFTNFYHWYDLDMDYRVYEVTYPVDLKINFINSIIYGIRDNEIFFDSIPDADLDYSFNHCLLKLPEDSVISFDSTKLTSLILNRDPGFVNDSISLGEYDFSLTGTSPAKNTGSLELIRDIPQLEYDFTGYLRSTDNQPDLGAYEYK
jgi:hypothetical protein